MPSAAEIRGSLVRALQADLIGPFDTGAPEERLTLPPSRWYLTGFLAPQKARDPGLADTDEQENRAEDDDDEPESPEGEAKQKNQFPASLGLSVLLPAARAGRADTIRATVTFADYLRREEQGTGREKTHVWWQRVPHAPCTVNLPLDPDVLERGVPLTETVAVFVYGKLERADAPGLPPGTRALSLFVVNQRPPGEPRRVDESFVFQVGLEVHYEGGFTPRPTPRGEGAQDLDEATADLQFRTHCEWGVGHNVAVEVPEGSGPVTTVRTTWIPTSEVRGVETVEDDRVTTEMEKLAVLTDGASVRTALTHIVDAYGAWIEGQRRIDLKGSVKRAEVRDRLMKNAERARRRIAAGIERLAADPEALEAFRGMNTAMAQAAVQRSPERHEPRRPAWRLFQLAFVLLSLESVIDEASPDRDEVELIFFPTGGGKTEAYLGVIAFTLLLRRLRGQSRPDGGLGVAVLLRYTLRLLTLDQLGRAATLVCALELLRRSHPKRLGDVRFAVGLWVGRTATANTFAQVKAQIDEYKGATAPSPFPLAACPWCGRTLGPQALVVETSGVAAGVSVFCTSPTIETPSDCPFAAPKHADGLPMVFVDEQIYREVPSFLVATVDKFAMLPWRGETGMLFGRVTSRLGRVFHGPMDREPKGAVRIPAGLRPPELIVQDELHLISGPLGTMVGLYETAIESLSQHTREDGSVVRPKVIAATATVRRAREQIRALFGRGDTSLFPPPGVDAGETFFAKVNHDAPGRLYVGVAAPGRALKAVLLRTYATLLSSAQTHYDPMLGEEQPADPYMTLAGYFNALRELGGMRRLVEDDVRTRAATVEQRGHEVQPGPHPWARNRTIGIPVELTSRENGAAIKLAKERLKRSFASEDHVDVLLASNMISVGVDIDRLGLMVVAGQPKTTSEYIQATSRVGRKYPGLVVTCFNVNRPRDRSHFERFGAYHQSFYRGVEATSVTPFSGPAIERGLAGILVAMARLGDPALTPASGAMAIEAHPDVIERCVKELVERGGRYLATDDIAGLERLQESLRLRGNKLFETWEKLVRQARNEGGGKRSYSPLDKDKAAGRPLLFSSVDERAPAHNTLDASFAAPLSMRDVEESVHFWIERERLRGQR